MKPAKCHLWISVQRIEEAGHLVVREFRISDAGRTDSEIRLEKFLQTKKKSADRLVLAVLKWKRLSCANFRKSEPCWKGLYELLRKRPKDATDDATDLGHMSFQQALTLLFPPPKDKKSRVFVIDDARFPRNGIMLRIDDSHATDAEIESLEKWIEARSGNDRNASDEFGDAVQPIRDFACLLASKLLLGGLDQNQQVLLGKAIWLDRLLLLKNILELRINESIRFLHSCLKARTLRVQDMAGFISRIDEIQRLLKDYLLDAATEAQYESESLLACLTALQRLYNDLSNKDELSMNEEMKKAFDIISTLQSEINRLMVALNERIARCRDLLKGIAVGFSSSSKES